MSWTLRARIDLGASWRPRAPQRRRGRSRNPVSVAASVSAAKARAVSWKESGPVPHEVADPGCDLVEVEDLLGQGDRSGRGRAMASRTRLIARAVRSATITRRRQLDGLHAIAAVSGPRWAVGSRPRPGGLSPPAPFSSSRGGADVQTSVARRRSPAPMPKRSGLTAVTAQRSGLEAAVSRARTSATSRDRASRPGRRSCRAGRHLQLQPQWVPSVRVRHRTAISALGDQRSARKAATVRASSAVLEGSAVCGLNLGSRSGSQGASSVCSTRCRPDDAGTQGLGDEGQWPRRMVESLRQEVDKLQDGATSADSGA